MPIAALRRTLARAYRRVFPRRAGIFEAIAPLARGRRGFEIGGPSQIFSREGLLPVYPIVASLDNSNYSSQTVWEGPIEEGNTFRFDPSKPAGRAYIREGTDLHGIASESFGIVLSSHTIEHIADPLRALREWLRILEIDGTLVLIVPHRDGTFDHRRPVSTLDHLIDDERIGRGEDDQTHVEEILALHDLRMDPPAGTPEEFRARSLRNIENRCLHHHVFDSALVARILDHLRLEIVAIEAHQPFHIIAVARKRDAGAAIDNARFLRPDAPYRAGSPFASDRAAGT